MADVALQPMKAVTGEVPTEDGWAFEIKWDGMRVVASFGDTTRALSTNGLDVTTRFPELEDLAGYLTGTRVVLDGEVVALDAEGRSGFGRLQPRMQASTPARVAKLRTAVPITFVVFDLLQVGDQPTVTLPYLDRRRLLADLLEDGPSWIVPTHQVGDGLDLYRAAAAQGLEGIMAKQVDSLYLPGKRSSSWRKCKVRHRQEVVIGGWTRGEGMRTDTLGALHVGVHDPSAPGNPLRYAGKVGTGLTDAALVDLHQQLAAHQRDDCPFDPPPGSGSGQSSASRRGTTWVDPVLVAEVEFAQWTADGHLRHPSYLGLRWDKDPASVVCEPGPGEG